MLAFSTSAVCFSFLLRTREAWSQPDAASAALGAPALGSFLVAFVSCLVFFLQLRIADEFKDYDEDARYRPYRPVQRGLVTLRELAIVFVLGTLLQLALALWLHPPLIVLLGVTWLYLAAMSKEFFVRRWLHGKHLLYMVSHMAIMPLIDLYATSSDWMPGTSSPPPGLFWFLLASYFNGMVIEIGRKIRAAVDEEEGVNTYSFVWGRGRAVAAWWLVLALTYACAVGAAGRIDFAVPLASGLAAVLLVAVILGSRFLSKGEQEGSGRVFEHLSGLWTLALYLGLGLIPFFVHKSALG